jgi:transposase
MVGVARGAVMIELDPQERAELERVLRAPSTPQQAATRARIVLRAAAGATNRKIASEVGLSELAVGRWRAKFVGQGMAGLEDRPRTGRPRTIDDATVQRVVAKTLEPPPAGESHWSVRRLAQQTGLAPATVHRIWRSHQLKPHQTRTFKYSTDPELEAKVIDIVGLYLNPPDGALVLCVDEKTQIQALDRTQPILPIRPGLPEGRTHDYRRHGTTSLYAALEIATGQVVTDCQPRHTAEEFLRFLRRIVRAYPQRQLHLVLDNSSTHSTPKVKAWLAAHRRVHFHYTPKGASWMNLVESWFSILTRRSVRRGSYHSVNDLIAAIERFVTTYNQHAQPFMWTKTANDILTKAKPITTSETEH